MVTNLLRPSTADLRERNFDASEALLIAQGMDPSPTSQWSTTALLMTLKRVLRTQPFHHDGTFSLARHVDGTSAFAYLGQRGVDPAKLLQHGFGSLLLLTLDSTLAINEFEGDASSSSDRRRLAEWQRLRRGVLEERDPVEHELRMSKSFRERLQPWVAETEISEALRWAPPAEMPEPVEQQSGTDYREFLWFVERFTNTYLTEWTDEALALEYRYVLEQWRPQYLPSELLLERDITAEKICHEISSRTVHGRPMDPQAQSVLVERALEAISEQRRDIAAVIFTAARTLDPKDAYLANNLGFCLIPDEPRKAIEALAEARALGQNNLLNFANTAAAYFILDDMNGALEACAEALTFGLERSHVAWLWALPVVGEPTVNESGLAVYICDLAILAASSLGDEPLAGAWRTRRGYFRGESSTEKDD